MFSSSKNICQLCGQGRVILYFIGSALTRYVKRKSLRKKYQSGSTMFPSEITCLVFVLNRKSHFSSEQPEKYQNIKYQTMPTDAALQKWPFTVFSWFNSPGFFFLIRQFWPGIFPRLAFNRGLAFNQENTVFFRPH